MLGQQRLDLGQHLLLDGLVLDHGLDHEVDATEIAERERRRDPREDLRHPAGRELAALDLLLEQLRRLGDARLERLRCDVLHQHRHAAGSRLVGDAAAHDPGAEHRGALHRPRGLRVLLRDPLHGLVAEEDAHRARGPRSSWRSSRSPPPRSRAPRRGPCPRPSRSPRWRRAGRGSAGPPFPPRRPSRRRTPCPPRSRSASAGPSSPRGEPSSRACRPPPPAACRAPPRAGRQAP